LCLSGLVYWSNDDYLPQWDWMPILKHFWFHALQATLNMANFCQGKHLRHDIPLPPSSLSDLLWASKEITVHCFPQIERKSNKTCTHTHIYILNNYGSPCREETPNEDMKWSLYGFFFEKGTCGVLSCMKSLNERSIWGRVYIWLLVQRTWRFITLLDGPYFWTEDWTWALSVGAVIYLDWDQPTCYGRINLIAPKL